MPTITFRITDVSTFEVLADVADEAAIEDFILANQRYQVSRRPFKGITIVETALINLNMP